MGTINLNIQAVADLLDFLTCAENGTRILGTTLQGFREDFDLPFESAVARALRLKGQETHVNGVSAYRIDLGIAHPDEPRR